MFLFKITKIETLVDELCEKLNDIEKQSANFEEDNHQLQEVLSAASVTSNTNRYRGSHNSHYNKATVGEISGGLRITSALSSSAAEAEDPRKRYYKAFPALSKDMDDSFRVLKRSTKSLTWPIDRYVNAPMTSSENIETSLPTTSTLSLTKKENTVEGEVSVALATEISNIQQFHNTETATIISNSSTAGVKRKSKRRRNQGKFGSNGYVVKTLIDILIIFFFLIILKEKLL